LIYYTENEVCWYQGIDRRGIEIMDKAVILRAAFWSGRMTYRKWRGIIHRGPEEHMRVFVQSFLHLPMGWLREEIGDEKFITIWPEVRKGFDENRPFEAASLTHGTRYGA
jgi:hypothetical protein